MKPIFFKLFFLVITCSVLVWGASCASQANEAESLQRADSYYEADELESARIEYLNVLKANENNPHAIQRLGLIYFAQNEIQQAIPFIRRAIELDPDDFESRLKMGLIYVFAGQPEMARSEALAVLEKEPENTEGLLILTGVAQTSEEIASVRNRISQTQNTSGDNTELHAALGQLFLKEANMESAETEFQQAVAMDDSNHAAHRMLGDIFWQTGRLDQAETSYRKAIEVAPEPVGYEMRLSEFLASNQRLEEAKESLNMILEANPEFLQAALLLSKIKLSERDVEGADTLIQGVLKSQPELPDGLLVQAKIFQAKGENLRAIEVLNKLRTVAPNSAEVAFQLGVALAAEQRYSEAKNHLATALRLNPGSEMATLMLAEVELASGEPTSAISRLNALLARRNGSVREYLLLAQAYRINRQNEDAIRVYSKLAEEFPENIEGPFYRGVVLRQANRVAEAKAAFERVLELQPTYLPAANQLLEMDLANKDVPASIERIREEAEKYPDSALPHFLLGGIHFSEEQFSEAEAELKRAIELKPDMGEAYLMLAQMYLKQENTSSALDKLEDSLKENPRDTSALMLKGIILEQTKKYSEAAEVYRSLLVLAPDFGPALNNLAYLDIEKLNKPDEAYQMARKANSLSPEDPFTADTYGWVLFKRQEYGWALNLLKQAYEKIPDHPEVQYHVGMANYFTGREEEAQEAFEKSLSSEAEFAGRSDIEKRLSVLRLPSKFEINSLLTETSKSSVDPVWIRELEELKAEIPEDPVIFLRLGNLYRLSGKLDEAAEAFKAAISINPEIVGAYAGLASVYSQSGNSSEALKNARTARDLDQRDPMLGWFLGRIATENKDFQWGLGLLTQSAAQLSDEMAVQLDLALAYYGVGRISNSKALVERILTADPREELQVEAETLRDMIFILSNRNQIDNYADTIATALEENSEYLPALFARALMAEAEEGMEQSKSRFEAIQSDYPTFPLVKKELARIALDYSENPKAAMDIAIRLRETLSGDPELAKLMGRIAYAQDDYDLAVRYLNESASVLSNDPEVFYYLGLSYHEQERVDSSREALEKSIALGLQGNQRAEAERVLGEM